MLKDIRQKSKTILNINRIDTRDADYIISEVLGLPITELNINREVDKIDEEKINQCIQQRVMGKPVSKIFNVAYFYGLKLTINENVLSPRPETELLVDKAIDYIKSNASVNRKIKILDLCCGSGAIACAIKHTCKNYNIDVLCADISPLALDIAKQNATNLQLDLNFIESDMFSNINKTFDLIVCNPPYIETKVCETLDTEVRNYDPILALDGGIDGLDYYRILANNISKLRPNGLLIMEIGYNQGESVCKIFNDVCKSVQVLKDYGNQNRIVVVKN